MNIMKKMGKRVCAAALAAVMLVGGCMSALASGNGSGDSIKGTFTFAAHDNDGDLTDSYEYSDSYFSNSAYEANIHLAVMSMILASSSISSKSTDDYTKKSRNIQDLLTQIGFRNIEVNQDYQSKMTQNSMGGLVAYKDLGDTVLLAVVPRSAGYEAEWGGNFNIGSSGLHAGFETGRNTILNFAKEYVSKYSSAFEGKTVKVWTAGYSRGAAVANLIGAALDEDSVGYLGLEVSPENIYAYTFGTPLTASEDLNPRAEKYNNIHNYYADYDAVTMLPVSQWNFDRYGKNELLDVYDADVKSLMLGFLSKTNPEVYKNYTESEDPDNFVNKVLALTDDNQIVIAQDPDSGLTQKAFLQDRMNWLTTFIPTRETYAAEYQTAVTEATALLIGEDDDVVAKFKEGAMGSSSLKPLAVMLFLYSWVEQYIQNKNLTTAAISDDWASELLPAPSDGTTEGEVSAEEALKAQILASDEYMEVYTALTSEDLSEQYNGGEAITTYGVLLEIYRQIAGNYMKNVLSAGLEKIGYSGEELENHALIQGNNAQALSVVAAQVLCGTADGLTLEGAMNKISTALNCATNNFLRVHNNEVILSWLRAMEASQPEEESSEESTEESSEETTAEKETETSAETTPAASTASAAETTPAQTQAVESAYTGDASNGLPWMFLSLAAAVSFLALTLSERRKAR